MNLLKQGEFKVGVFFSNKMQATSEIVNIHGVFKRRIRERSVVMKR